MHSLAEGQPFIDGNKRTAWLAGEVFLQIHGVTIEASDIEALDLFTNRIANGMLIAELARWIDAHLFEAGR
jgi:death-on-curing protein